MSSFKCTEYGSLNRKTTRHEGEEAGRREWQDGKGKRRKGKRKASRNGCDVAQPDLFARNRSSEFHRSPHVSYFSKTPVRDTASRVSIHIFPSPIVHYHQKCLPSLHPPPKPLPLLLSLSLPQRMAELQARLTNLPKLLSEDHTSAPLSRHLLKSEWKRRRLNKLLNSSKRSSRKRRRPTGNGSFN